MRRLAALGAGALGALALVPASAGAATFENGRCTVPGTVTFNANVASVPGGRTYTLSSDPGARCDGRLDGVDVTGRAVVVSATGSGTFSCGFSQSQGGSGTLRFPNSTADPADDQVVAFTGFDFVSQAGTIAFKSNGASGGIGGGAGELLSNASLGVIQACAGSGIRSAKFGAQILTGPGFSG